MSAPRNWLRPWTWAVTLVGAAIVIGAYFFRAALTQREAIASVSSTIELGMARDTVDRLCERACLEHPGWKYHGNVSGLTAPVALLQSPLSFGAKNWVVVIAFDHNSVAGVLVRTDDTLRIRPDRGPKDRVRDDRAPWLAQFRQE